ncbi:MAG: ribonuclease Z [Candidatus Aenigmatarchaeota archaeon]
MKIVFLGTASGIPTKRRSHPSIWIEYQGDVLLWDCGEGTQRQILKAGLNFMKIDKIFISHWHADHFAGLMGLIETFNLESRKKKLEIFGPEASKFTQIMEELSHWNFGFDVEPMDLNFEGDGIDEIYKTEKYSVFSTPVEHSIPAVGFCFKENDRWNIDTEKAGKKGLKPGPKMKKLKKNGEIEFKGKTIKLEDVAKKTIGKKVVYSGDTKPCDNVENISKDADVLIHDGTFIEGETERHSSVDEAARLAKRANVKKLVLTHFSRRYAGSDLDDILEKAKEEFDKVELAEDFLEIEI